MAGPTSIPKFFNLHMAPAPGGWHFWFDADRKQYPVIGGSAQQVFDRIKNYQTNNRAFTSDDAIWQMLWKYWCSLEPARCLERKSNAVSVPPPKEVWGPIVWRMLNWAAVNWRPTFFEALVQEVRERFIPCPECQAHFDQILIRRPVSRISSVLTACRWINEVHNEVNLSIGKPNYSYAQMAADYGAPL